MYVRTYRIFSQLKHVLKKSRAGFNLLHKRTWERGKLIGGIGIVPSSLQAQTALRNIACFAEYPVRMQRKIVEVGRYEKYDSKRVIVRQGHPASAFYFILSGSGACAKQVLN